LIIAVSVLMVAGCKTELYTNLDQRQANEMVMTLKQHGILAERVIGKADRVSVVIDPGDFAEAITILDDNGLPRQQFATLGEVFKRDGLVSSPAQERAQMIYALSEELSKTVSDIDGVLTARVHLVLPENNPLREQSLPSSASVFIRHRATTKMDSLVPQIKMLVANGVAGLSYEKVSVVLLAVQAQANERAVTSQRQDVLRAGILSLGWWSGWMWLGLGAAVVLLAGIGGFLVWRYRRVYPLQTSQVAKSS